MGIRQIADNQNEAMLRPLPCVELVGRASTPILGRTPVVRGHELPFEAWPIKHIGVRDDGSICWGSVFRGGKQPQGLGASLVRYDLCGHRQAYVVRDVRDELLGPLRLSSAIDTGYDLNDRFYSISLREELVAGMSALLSR